MDLSAICSCHPSTSHTMNSSNIPNASDQSSNHMTERKRSLPPNMMRWQQTRGTQAMASPTYDSIAAMETPISHLGKYLPTLPHFLSKEFFGPRFILSARTRRAIRPLPSPLPNGLARLHQRAAPRIRDHPGAPAAPGASRQVPPSHFSLDLF
jgi:hypothetical protein